MKPDNAHSLPPIIKILEALRRFAGWLTALVAQLGPVYLLLMAPLIRLFLFMADHSGRNGNARVQTQTLLGLSFVAVRWGRLSKARAYVERSLKIALAAGLDEMLGLSWFRMAEIEVLSGHAEAGVAAGRRAYALIEPLNQPFYLANVRQILADAYRLANALDESDDCLRANLAFHEELNQLHGAAHALYGLGLNLMRRERYLEAKPWLEKSLALYKPLAMFQEAAAVQHSLHEADIQIRIAANRQTGRPRPLDGASMNIQVINAKGKYDRRGLWTHRCGNVCTYITEPGYKLVVRYSSHPERPDLCDFLEFTLTPEGVTQVEAIWPDNGPLRSQLIIL